MWNKIRMFFSTVWKVIQPTVLKLVDELTPEVLAMIEGIVLELATSDLSGEDKRSEAIERIKARLKRDGVSLRSSLINTAIELAVQRLKVS